MRFLLYNIRYGVGGNPFATYLGRTAQNTTRIAQFIDSVHPDVAGLIEVDAGSYRCGRRNQAELIAESTGHYHAYRGKYGDRSPARHLPILNKQGNAFLARDSIRTVNFHYFRQGMKRLCIELDLARVVIFLVHLSLQYRVRHHQLGDLYDLVRKASKPVIVAGDFNALWGEHEIRLFLGATGLLNANRDSIPSYPSWAPRRHLDFILHSPAIRPTGFDMPKVRFSDHLPLVFEFEV